MDHNTRGNAGGSSKRLARLKRRERQIKVKRLIYLFVCLFLICDILIVITFVHDRIEKKNGTAETEEKNDIILTRSMLYEGDLLELGDDFPLPVADSDDLVLLADTDFYHLSASSGESVDTMYLASNALSHFNEMCNAFYQDTGLDSLTVVKAYSSTEPLYAQGNTVELAVRDSVTGNISNMYRDTPQVGQWMDEHAHEYGFVLTDAVQRNERKTSKTFRYIGVAQATCFDEIADGNQNYSLSDYFDRLHGATSKNPLTVSVQGKKFYTYFLSADGMTGDSMSLELSRKYTFVSVSGDNQSGWFITLTR